MTICTILVVDDGFATQMFCNRFFSSQGFEVTICKDGQEGLDLLLGRGPEFGLVLLDLHMPRLDGFGLLRGIGMPDRRAEWPPFLLHTSDVTEAVCAEAAALGVQQVVRKPGDAWALLRLVQETIASRASCS